MVENLKATIGKKCDNMRDLMRKSHASKRSNVRQLRVLAQDIIEIVTEVLDINDAKRILYELLQDMGWEEGQVINQNTTMSMFCGDVSTIDNSKTGRDILSTSERLLKNEFLSVMGLKGPDLLTD